MNPTTTAAHVATAAAATLSAATVPLVRERRTTPNRAPLATNWRRGMRWLALTVAALLVLSVVAKLSARFGLERHSWTAAQVVSRFDVDVEASVPTWFSNLLLSFAAAQLLLVGLLQRGRSTALARYWTALGGVFTLLSADEIMGLHNTPLVSESAARAVSDYLAISWVVHGMAGVALLGLVFIPFLRALPRPTALGLIGAGGVYVGGALLMEMIGSHFIVTRGYEHPISSAVITVEEGMEMLGVVLLIGTLFRYIEREFPGLGVAIVADRRRPPAPG